MSETYDLIIIGGGPAGLSAAIYSTRAGYKTLILEKIGFGGQMMLTDIIDNYAGFPEGITGFELQDRMLKQAERFGLKHAMRSVKKIEKKDDLFMIHTDDSIYQSVSVIIATGANHRQLDVPGENEFSSKGVSYCGTCDAPFFRGKEVIVVGGGDTAVSEALFISKFADKVKIVHRKDRFRAVKFLVDQADKKENIEYVFNTHLAEIIGDNIVTGVKLQDIKTKEFREEKIDGVFVFVGINPNTDFVNPSLLNDEKYIITNKFMETDVKGLFAAGDVRNSAFRQVICAASDGAIAYEYAGKYIDELKGVAYK